MPPYCNICSYRQLSPRPQRSVHHRHFSAREVRIMQGVEFSTTNTTYMCPTCMTLHPIWPDYGLNVCLGTSQLHNIHHPRDTTVSCPADPLHIDWLTVSGGTIPDLEDAFLHDYKKQTRPMRILISAGLNDLVRGATRTKIMEHFLNLKRVVADQNFYHPHTKNELVIATILNPPKLVWFPDNGPPPANHVNLYQDIKELNDWIVLFNNEGNKITPRFHRFGVRSGTKMLKDATKVPFKTHQWNQWRQSEPVHDMLHLNDFWRVRMGGAVIKHFQGEHERFGKLG